MDRLRSSWTVEALVPFVDRDPKRRRQWRAGIGTALALHVVAIVGIVVIGKLALATFVEKPTIIMLPVSKNVAEPTDDPTEPADAGGSPKAGEANAGSTSDGGGSHGDTPPVTNGQPPLQSPTPPIPAPVVPPTVSPSLVVPITVQGPIADVAPPTVSGIPTAPPGDAPSLGPNPGNGVGTGVANGYGPGDGNGAPGNGLPGNGGKGSGTDPASRERGNGPGTGLGDGPPVGARDHGIRFVQKVRPAIPKAMIEAGTSGTVRIQVTVGANGVILSADPIDELANGGTEAALAALYKCQFEPAVSGGKYVTSSAVVRFDIAKPGR